MTTIQFHADLTDLPADRRYAVSYGGMFHALVPHTAESRAALLAAEPEWGAGIDRLSHYTPTPIDRPPARRVARRATVGFFDAESGAWTIRRTALITRRDANVRIDYLTTLWTYLCHHPDMVAIPSDGGSDADEAQISAYAAVQALETDPTVLTALNILVVSFSALSEDDQWLDGTAVQLSSSATPVTPSVPNVWDTSSSGGNPSVMDAATAAVQALTLAAQNSTALNGSLYTINYAAAVSNATASASTGAVEDFAGGATLADSTTSAGSSTIVSPMGPMDGVTVTPVLSVVDGVLTLSVSFSNTMLRWLGLDILPVNADGSLGASVWPSSTVALCPPCDSTLGFADTDEPGMMQVASVALGTDAIGAAIYTDSLGMAGTFTNATAFIGGAAMTAIFNLMIPAIFLAAAVEEIGEETIELNVESMSESLIDFVKEQLPELVDGDLSLDADTVESLAESFASELAVGTSDAFAAISTWLGEEITGEELLEAIPFVGWGLAALAVVSDLAALCATITSIGSAQQEIVTSATYSGSLALTVTVPDPVPFCPDGATWTLQVIGQYDGPSAGANANRQFQTWTFPDIDLTQDDNTVSVTLSNILADGSTVCFLVKLLPVAPSLTSWTSAMGTTTAYQLLPANLTANSSLSVTLTDLPVPITSSLTYSFQSRLCYTDPGYQWNDTVAALGATFNPSSGYDAGDISQLLALELNAASHCLTLGWRSAGTGLTDERGSTVSGQIIAFALLSDATQDTVTLQLPANGLSTMGSTIAGPTGTGPQAGSAPGYVIDATPLGADEEDAPGYHARQVGALGDQNAFASLPSPGNATPPSWGRVPAAGAEIQALSGNIADAAIHPSGHVVAVNSTNGNLFILPAPASAGTTQADAPVARLNAGHATGDDGVLRVGLLANPLAVTVSSDGIIFVLELGSSTTTTPRLQAFSITGQPSQMFNGGAPGTTSATLELPPGAHYFDIAVVGDAQGGFIFVSSCTGTYDEVANYGIAVYPFGATATSTDPVVTVTGIPAARLAVDPYHNLYTLDFGPVTQASGTPPGRTVPSVSLWVAEAG